MENIRDPRYLHETDSIIRLAIRGFIAIILFFLILLGFGSCGGGGGGGESGGGGDGNTDSHKVVLTATAVSSDSINLSWTNPADYYIWTPEEVFSYIYRGGVKISTTYGFSYIDTGLQPDTMYCYDVTVGAVYCFLFSCSTTGWQSNTACVTTLYGLRMQSTSPVSGEWNVPVNAIISATFNGKIDPLSVTSSSFIVSGPSGIISGTLAVNGSTVTFTPSSYLLYNASYTATIVSGVKDLGGYTLSSDYAWTFTTGFTPDNIPPSTPSGLTATPVTTTQIDLSWNKATDNAGIAGYKIFRDGLYVKSVPYTEAAASDTGLNEITQYCYSVSAYDWAGNESPRSSSVCVKPLGFSVKSTSPSAGAGSIPVNSTIAATFNAEVDPLSVTSSSFIVSSPSGIVTGSLAVNGSTVTFTPYNYLNYKTSYTVTITAAVRDVAGYSMSADYTWTFISGLTPDSVPPSTPTGLAAKIVTTSQVDLSWNPSTDNAEVYGYSIYVNGICKLFSPATTAISDTGLYLNMQYCYSVSALDVAGNESIQSDPVCVTMPDLVPGSVGAWGYNYDGQLGDGTTANKMMPIQISNLTNVIAISAGANFSLALKSDGTLLGWGRNDYGQIGDGTTTSKTIPSQISNLTDVVAISAGYDHSLAVKSNGSVWAWGRDDYCKLGIGGSCAVGSYVSAPVQVLNMANVVAISSGRYHSLALKSDGSVWAWGDIDYSTIIWSGIPVRISELTNVVAISAGSYYSVALKSDGSAWAWGYNNSGELGDGTVIQRTLPVQVNNISNIISISAGNMHSLALRSDGTVWAWGYNSQGELGNGTTTNNSTTPVQSAKLTDVVAISAGGFHSLALKSDGTVWAWGDDIYSELGDGVIKYYTMSNVPVQTYKLNGIVAIDAGLYHSMALK